jgi:hypothetical protein
MVSPMMLVESHVKSVAHDPFLPSFHVNAVNRDGDTPLRLTIKGIERHDNEPLPILQYLWNHPFIIVYYRNNNGKTPLDVAQTMLGSGR